MATVRKQILDATVSLCRTIDPFVELNASGDPDSFPSLNVQDGGNRVIEGEVGSIRRELSITIEGVVEGGDGDEASADLDALYAQVFGLMMADETFGGLAELIDEGDLRTDVVMLAAERRLGFAQDFTIQFATLRSDPSQPA
jgi:hypothetical protein